MGETFESISGIFINFLEAAEEIIEGLFEEYLEKKKRRRIGNSWKNYQNNS